MAIEKLSEKDILDIENLMSVRKWARQHDISLSKDERLILENAVQAHDDVHINGRKFRLSEATFNMFQIFDPESIKMCCERLGGTFQKGSRFSKHCAMIVASTTYCRHAYVETVRDYLMRERMIGGEFVELLSKPSLMEISGGENSLTAPDDVVFVESKKYVGPFLYWPHSALLSVFGTREKPSKFSARMRAREKEENSYSNFLKTA